MKPRPSFPSGPRLLHLGLRPLARGLAFAVLLGLGGCMVGPDYKPPVTKTPENWAGLAQAPDPTQTSLVAPSNITIVDWWTTLSLIHI